MIYVTNCGHDSHHPKPCNIEYKHGLADYLLLLIKQNAWLCLDGEKKEILPNSIICFPPNSYIHYGCDLAGYNDDWIHFTIENESILQELQIPFGTILYPRNFHKLSEYVKLMTDAFHTTAYKEQIVDSFMHIFLYSLQEELNKSLDASASSKYFQAFSALRTQIYNNPADVWNVDQLAGTLSLSLSYFQHLYKQFFGYSCKQDMIHAKLELAKYYLQNSEMSIQELSDFCGYENALHFMRQFKKFVGMTPSEYRNRTVG